MDLRIILKSFRTLTHLVDIPDLIKSYQVDPIKLFSVIDLLNQPDKLIKWINLIYLLVIYHI